ncbi:MAG: SH3 domain-containing protein [Proteobacteria bacterium]|nr:SH3 domain-containing protein [Pseudomonadota bacterium]
MMSPRCTRWVWAIVGLLAGPLLAAAQEATTNRNANLRRDPSTASPALAVLPRGARVTLVDAGEDGGFYHVRTEDDQVGWIYAKLLTLAARVPAGAGEAPLAAHVASCDATLWNHVYHPARLIVKDACISVTGTLVDATAGRKADGVRHEADGDTHGWLRVDPEFAGLLNAGNRNEEGGNLVFEVICHFPVTQKDALSACSGYHDPVTLPPPGSRVRITGSYVQDTFHAQWNEIHPVTSITVIP